LAKKKDKFALT
jgi:hypothetical protein